MEHIITQPTGKGTIVCRYPYPYKKVTIRHNQESNGANIPRVFWFLFPPFHPDTLTATFVHDVLCQQEQYTLADQYYAELLEQSGVPKWKRICLVTGVKSWHKIAYKKNNQPRAWLNLYRKVKNYEY